MNLRERTTVRLISLCRETGQSTDAPIRLDLTQTEFASMLGASRQATNGMLGELESIGAIRRGFRHLVCMQSILTKSLAHG